MNLENFPTKVSVFLNKNISQSCESKISSHTGLADLLSDCKTKLQINAHSKCILFDSNGAELSDDDIEFLNTDEPLFLSLGEHFTKASSLALYTEVCKLGEGGFGSVSLFQHKISKEQVAIKFIKLNSLISPEDIQRVYSEIAVLRELRHPNIVRLQNAFTLNKDICFIMDYCSGGELGEYLEKHGPLSDAKIYPLALQIVDAIRYCHNSKIVHRDLKPENILFSTKTCKDIKIVDFGIAGMFDIGKSGERSNAGSILYVPPEVYKRTDNRANPAIDIWAIGCIFYYLLTGKHPFMHETSKEIIESIENAMYEPLTDLVSKPWHRLIRAMLRKNPVRRWDMMKVQQHLEKYYENPEDVVSEESEEVEEVEEVKAPIGILKTYSVKSGCNKLKAPKIHFINKSHSPNPKKLDDSPYTPKRNLPTTPRSMGKKIQDYEKGNYFAKK